VATATATVAIPGFDAITLEGLALVRPVDPADTALAEQVCQVASDIDGHSKLKGRRLPRRSTPSTPSAAPGSSTAPVRRSHPILVEIAW
jgi:hypothetical protein